MLKNDTRTIGRYKYRVTQLPTGAGRQMLVRLTKALGPVLGRLIEGGKLTGMGRGELSEALRELAERLSQDDLEYVCDTFGNSTAVILDSGKAPQLTLAYQELHFPGCYLEMLKWIAFAVEVNYRDFFDAAGVSSAAPAEAPEA